MCLLNSVCNVHIERRWTGHRCRIIAIFNVLSIRNDNEISNIQYEVNVLILKNNRDKSRRLKLYSSLHCKASCTLPAGCTETRMLVFSSLNSEFSRLLPQSTVTDFYIWVFSTIVIRNTHQKYKLKHTLRHHFVNKQISFQLTKKQTKNLCINFSAGWSHNWKFSNMKQYKPVFKGNQDFVIHYSLQSCLKHTISNSNYVSATSHTQPCTVQYKITSNSMDTC